jgi:hypothetical protein
MGPNSSSSDLAVGEFARAAVSALKADGLALGGIAVFVSSPRQSTEIQAAVRTACAPTDRIERDERYVSLHVLHRR